MMQVKSGDSSSCRNSFYQSIMEVEMQHQDRPPLPPRGPPLLLNHYRQQGSLDGYGPYSSVPAPKPVGRSAAVTPPPYRMPPHPLPPLPPLPGAVTEQPPPSPAYHTHSNKFPIERELVLSSSDKNNKIPILSEYNKRPRSVVPEGPIKQVAWEREGQYQQAFNQDIVQSAGDRENSYVSFNDPHQRNSVDLERGVRDGNDKTKISKTYYSIKDMISNRFSKSKENVDDPKQMNNQGVDSVTGPMQTMSLGPRPQRPNPPLPVLRGSRPNYPEVQSPLPLTPSCELLSPPAQPNFSPSCEVLSPVAPSTPLSAQQQERRLQQQRYDSHGVYATARAYVVQARPPAQRRAVRTAGPSTELSHSSPNLTANLESNGVYISKTPTKYPPSGPKGGSETDDDGGFKRGPPLPETRPPMDELREGFPLLPQDAKLEAMPQTEKVSSATSSDYEKATRGSSVGDSGRGSAAYSSGRAGSAELARPHDPEPPEQQESQRFTPNHQRGKEWVDMVESELRQILDPKMQSGACSSTLSDSVSSLTPPLPPLSPGGGSSPTPTPRHVRHKNTSLPLGVRPEYEKDERKYGSASKNQRSTVGRRDWSRNGKPSDTRSRQSSSSKSKFPPGLMSMETDLGSTTTGPLDSVLDSRLSIHSSDEDMSTTIDANDAMAIRRQLHGLENMYSEVLKLLGVKKYGAARYPGSEARAKRRYGSMSSLPSSVSSRPIRDKRRDDRKKVRDIKGINKRFQRLESHVVTLARSVAHLSSEMRTQHLMIQEMENIRGEMAQLRAQSGGNRSMSVPRALNSLLSSPTTEQRDPQALTNPSRVKKLTKFFGDEPPLLRIFLRRLGYEKYAGAFEAEKIGMVELPYLTEERLQKMGLPMGPRLRILQEAQISFCRDSVYVV